MGQTRQWDRVGDNLVINTQIAEADEEKIKRMRVGWKAERA